MYFNLPFNSNFFRFVKRLDLLLDRCYINVFIIIIIIIIRYPLKNIGRIVYN